MVSTHHKTEKFIQFAEVFQKKNRFSLIFPMIPKKNTKTSWHRADLANCLMRHVSVKYKIIQIFIDQRNSLTDNSSVLIQTKKLIVTKKNLQILNNKI